jgi:hypothetical protein
MAKTYEVFKNFVGFFGFLDSKPNALYHLAVIE